MFRNRQSIVFNWTANPAEEIVKFYRVYVDGVRVSTVNDEYYRTSYSLSGLDSSTSYDITIQAFDSQLNSSPISSALTVVTLASDTEKPTAPSAPRWTSINYEFETIDIEWDASTDNVAVTGYDVFLDDVLNSTSTNTSATVTGMVSGQVHEIFIRAKDAAGNYNDSPITQLRINFTVQ